MNTPRFSINLHLLLAVLAITGLYKTEASASALSEKSKIELLLNALDDNDLIFVGDDGEKSGVWAKEHLREQYYEMNPPVSTATEFIDLIATRSAVTGRPYLIKVRNNPTMSAQKWFRTKLYKKMED